MTISGVCIRVLSLEQVEDEICNRFVEREVLLLLLLFSCDVKRH